MKRSSGMLLGKFMPPHKGHIHLIEFARERVDDLTVVVCTLDTEPIPGDLRYKWMQELFPGTNIVHITDALPQEPSEDPEFWSLWRTALMKVLQEKPDYIFASEEYGYKLAEVLGGKFVPVDIGRNAVPISASKIRESPIDNWEYIPDCVRPYYLRRICIFGPESTGKTILAEKLGRHFNTAVVPEYARSLLESQDGKIEIEDIDKIARGQIGSEDNAASGANKILICDTNLLLTKIWSESLFGKCPDWILEEISCRSYDLYLLTDIDVPWVEDKVRYLPKGRAHFMDKCRDELAARNLEYITIRGTWAERYNTAVTAIEKRYHLG